ncbi:MAG: hypothetical protein HS132_08710 [Planctomycetia bacterium]|nr:hypothetical protein [Planctomycetia bacterium]
MDSSCILNENQGNVTFAKSECSDGMCCFTCVIPPKNEHIGFFRFLWKKGTGYPHVKLLVTSEGYKNELYDSCKFLDFTIFSDTTDARITMDLRCGIYKSRPVQCRGYPDEAGESVYQKISGPCIFNEYAASGDYKKLVYKRDWQAFYAIRDDIRALGHICPSVDTTCAREKILKTKDVHLATLTIHGEEFDYILIPIPKKTQNILYLSRKHQPVSTIRQAYREWQEKIEKNLQNHYGQDWEIRLKNAIEMEEKDACKRCDEDTAGNIEC